MARRRLRPGARRPARDECLAHRAGLPYRDSQEKAYSTDANIWGATHEAKTLEHLDVSLETVEPIMGVKFWDPGGDRDRGRDHPLRRAARSRSTARPSPTTWPLVLEANTIGGRHGLGMSDQIENRIIEAKSRGIYEAPGMALLWLAYERLLNAIHNEDTIANYHPRGAAWAVSSRRPLARPTSPHDARVHPALDRLRRHRRGHDSPAPRRGTTRSSTPPDPPSPTSLSGSRWSAPRAPPSARATGSGSSPCATSTSPTPATSLELHAQQPVNEGASARRARHHLRAPSPGRTRPDHRGLRRGDRAGERAVVFVDGALGHD